MCCSVRVVARCLYHFCINNPRAFCQAQYILMTKCVFACLFLGRELYHLRMKWILFQCGNFGCSFYFHTDNVFLEFIHNRVNNLHTFLQILWFSVDLSTSVSCTYKADPHDTTSLLLKVALITIPPPFKIALIKKIQRVSSRKYLITCDVI